ncbi:MAG: aminotransferase class I/II-fold pyridoxal phosphate-dependent enzyme [Candidatus Heimdallarchaeota archaeon]|nr:aminotransferase class I/II-fold pyridoxal phosphate-dependent enzyme [Candidatus Heimdallarchaeota archaeon]MCK4875996.1 aminotransferase class I/II-fold pyridoxal phosphate-dependent enzyme [Candidatus Heimdallarchaeota archaeon]
MDKKDKRNLKFDTLCLHAGHDVFETNSIVPPIYQSVAYPYESAEYAAKLYNYEIEGFTYGRMDNPTNKIFEDRLAALELTEKGLLTSSGMAAEFIACIGLLENGDAFVTSGTTYGGTNQLFNVTFPKFGMNPIRVSKPEVLDNWAEAITKRTKFLFVETPSNPNLFIGDIDALAKLAHDYSIPLVVDNTIGSPALQQPAKMGADIMVHSGTKFLSGNSTCISGAITGSTEYINHLRKTEYRNIGPSISPFNSWLLLLGVETLGLRMKKHSENAQAVAEFFEDHSKVLSVNYPGLKSHPQHELAKKQMKGFSALLSFVTKGELEDAKNVIDAFNLIIHAGHLGTSVTLATHPAFSTHQQLTQEERDKLGIPDTMIRLSVGLEDVDDLIEDIDQALSKVN